MFKVNNKNTRRSFQHKLTKWTNVEVFSPYPLELAPVLKITPLLKVLQSY